MYRILSVNFLAVLLIPIALFLVLLGIKRLDASGKSGVFLKSLLAVNTMLLVLAGSASACVMIANASPRYCYVEEILSYERNSDWAKMNQTNLKRMVAITK